MEREALMSKPLISYLSSINDENRSGVRGEGHKSKTAENLPEYEEETKTIKHVQAAAWHWLGTGKYLKRGISGRVYLQNPRFLYKKPLKLLYKRT